MGGPSWNLFAGEIGPTFPMASLPELDTSWLGQAGVFAVKLSSKGFSLSSVEVRPARPYGLFPCFQLCLPLWEGASPWRLSKLPPRTLQQLAATSNCCSDLHRCPTVWQGSHGGGLQEA